MGALILWQPIRLHGTWRFLACFQSTGSAWTPRGDSNINRKTWLVGGLFLLSGFSALVYELIWTQQLGLVFGASASANTAVLAAYMLGLGVGAALGARWVQRVRRPLLVYAVLEVGVAASALLVVPLLAGARHVYGALFRAGWLDGLGASGFYLLASFVILGLPTVMMGATLPLLVRWCVERREQISRGVAGLYLANTLGASLGTLTTGFWLIPTLGLGSALAVAVAINLGVAVAVLIWPTSRRPLAALPDEPTSAKAAPPQPSLGKILGSEKAPSGNLWIMGPLVAVSGMVGMAYEVYWSRALTHVLGGSLYAFTIMLASFLVGIALGSSLTTLRRWSSSACWAGFGVAQAGLGVTAWLAIWAVGQEWVLTWIQAAPLSPASLALVGLTLVPGAMLLGVSFPLAVGAVSTDAGDAAVQSGRIYACSTAGTILGAALCGFWWLPALQFSGTAALLMTLSAVAAAVSWALRGGGWRWASAAALAGAVAVQVVPPQTPWKLLTHSPLFPKRSSVEVAYLGVGQSATVMLTERSGELRLTTDGLPESAIQPPGGRPKRYEVAHWLALLPSAVRPNAQNALVIGFGAGITTSAFPERIASVEVAEIEPEVVEANRRFAHRRLEDPLADPRLTVHLADARNLLAVQDTQYDVMVSQPSHPWTLGASSLFTAEFYRLAKSRLEPSGVFLQWIGLRFVDDALFRSQMATLLDVFEYVEVYRPPPLGAALLLASDAPLDDVGALEESWSTDGPSWRRVGVHNVEDVLLGRWLDPSMVRDVASGAEVSTDYRNLLATRAPKLLRSEGTRFGVQGFAPEWDAVSSLQAGRDDLHPLRRLLTLEQFDRAAKALEGVTSPRRRALARALLDLKRGNHHQGELALRRWLEEASTQDSESDRVEALSALLIANAQRVEGVPPWLVTAIESDPVLHDVWRAWRANRLGDTSAVKALDGRLGRIDPRHPIFPMAFRLRVQWRQRLGDPVSSQQALALLDAHMESQADVQTLLLRARLAFGAGNWEALWDSLFEMEPKVRASKRPVPRALGTFLRQLDRQPKTGQDPRRQQLDDLFTKAAANGR